MRVYLAFSDFESVVYLEKIFLIEEDCEEYVKKKNEQYKGACIRYFVDVKEVDMGNKIEL